MVRIFRASLVIGLGLQGAALAADLPGTDGAKVVLKPVIPPVAALPTTCAEVAISPRAVAVLAAHPEGGEALVAEITTLVTRRPVLAASFVCAAASAPVAVQAAVAAGLNAAIADLQRVGDDAGAGRVFAALSLGSPEFALLAFPGGAPGVLAGLPLGGGFLGFGLGGAGVGGGSGGFGGGGIGGGGTGGGSVSRN